jgi:hypothetical protein
MASGHLGESFRVRIATDWLPDDLLCEIEKHYPSSPQEISTSADGVRLRDQEAFRQKAGAFFVPNRVFVKYIKFVACGKHLLDSWAVSASHSAKSLYCFYGKPYKRNYASKGVRTSSTLKDLECPFRI